MTARQTISPLPLSGPDNVSGLRDVRNASTLSADTSAPNAHGLAEADQMLARNDHVTVATALQAPTPSSTAPVVTASARSVPLSFPRLLNVGKRASLEKSFFPRLLLNPSKKRASLDICDSGGRARIAKSWGNNHTVASSHHDDLRESATGNEGDASSPTSDFTKCRSPSSSLMTPASIGNPLITITIEPDHDSLFHDYISPDVRLGLKEAPLFVGDDVSLYGVPREDLSPVKETSPTHQSTTDFLKDQIISFFQPSDNKLAMKLFGNKNALNREKKRQKEAGNWVIHPCSNFRSVVVNFQSV